MKITKECAFSISRLELMNPKIHTAKIEKTNPLIDDLKRAYRFLIERIQPAYGLIIKNYNEPTFHESSEYNSIKCRINIYTLFLNEYIELAKDTIYSRNYNNLKTELEDIYPGFDSKIIKIKDIILDNYAKNHKDDSSELCDVIEQTIDNLRDTEKLISSISDEEKRILEEKAKSIQEIDTYFFCDCFEKSETESLNLPIYDISGDDELIKMYFIQKEQNNNIPPEILELETEEEMINYFRKFVTDINGEEFKSYFSE